MVIAVGYYILAFDPAHDPYVSSSDAGAGETATWRENSIDKYFIGRLRWLLAKLLPRWTAEDKLLDDLRASFSTVSASCPNLSNFISSIEPNSNESLPQCLMQLCDTQIITGIGILVASYASLGSGLSAFHWQMAVCLAWFSNLTHLSGLTFLRTYLYTHPRERNLRATFMAILFIMLVVSEIPTVFFNWPNSFESLAREYITTGQRPAAFPSTFALSTIEVTGANSSSFATCYFNVHRSALLYQEQVDWYKSIQENDTNMIEEVFRLSRANVIASLADTTAFQSTLISILILVFSFITRSIKLFKTSSRLVRCRIRPFCSFWARRITIYGHNRLLKSIETRGERRGPEISPDELRRKEATLLYLYTKPVLALIIVSRLYADLYSSMLSEVYWLAISATWGSLRLASLRKSVSVYEEDLTFGQILAILFLAAPVLAVVVSLWPTLSALISLNKRSNRRKYMLYSDMEDIC